MLNFKNILDLSVRVLLCSAIKKIIKKCSNLLIKLLKDIYINFIKSNHKMNITSLLQSLFAKKIVDMSKFYRKVVQKT